MGQYVDFVEEPDETAHSRWYDTLLAGFILLKRDFGEEIAAKICNLSLRDGGNVDTLFRLMEEGQLAASPPSFPKLRDVSPQTTPDMTPQL